ncbi:MAG: hypothetical protein M5R42_02015 [Rhodocyclaceae bacterium]|nr:hypothetical protein [Rhodocyclaceae bacterium]
MPDGAGQRRAICSAALCFIAISGRGNLIAFASPVTWPVRRVGIFLDIFPDIVRCALLHSAVLRQQADPGLGVLSASASYARTPKQIGTLGSSSSGARPALHRPPLIAARRRQRLAGGTR